MNRNVLARATLAAITLAAAAAVVARPPPEIVALPSRNGEVRFPHRKHWSYVEGGCRTCHAVGDTGRLSSTLPHIYGKEGGHAFCKGCHEQLGRGPSMCSRCHEGSGAREAALKPPPPPDPNAPPEPWPPRLRPVRPDRAPDEGPELDGATRSPQPSPPQGGGAGAEGAPTPNPNPSSTSTPHSTSPPHQLGDRVPTPGEAEAALIREIEEQEARERAEAAARGAKTPAAPTSSGLPGKSR